MPWFEFKTIPIGPLTIQVWGLFVALGITLAIAIVIRLSKKKNINTERILQQVWWMILLGFVGARFFHVFLYEPSFYLQNPVEILKIWQGGLSSFGGLFGAVLGFFLFAWRKKISNKSLWKHADIMSQAALFGWIVARVGCFFIHDHLGIQLGGLFSIDSMAGSDLELEVLEMEGKSPRLELALVEIVALVPLAVFWILSWSKKKKIGFYTVTLLIYYGVLRIILDFFRAADGPGAEIRYLKLTPGQLSAILLVIFAIWLKNKSKELNS